MKATVVSGMLAWRKRWLETGLALFLKLMVGWRGILWQVQRRPSQICIAQNALLINDSIRGKEVLLVDLRSESE